jgi:hypothetical protein
VSLLIPRSAQAPYQLTPNTVTTAGPAHRWIRGEYAQGGTRSDGETQTPENERIYWEASVLDEHMLAERMLPGLGHLRQSAADIASFNPSKSQRTLRAQLAGVARSLEALRDDASDLLRRVKREQEGLSDGKR